MTELLAAGTATATRLVRTASGEPRGRMLLLHGLGCGTGGWRPLISAVPADFEVWEAQLPWTVGGDRSWSLRGDSTHWLVEAFAGVDGPVDVVVAHSFSANMVLELLTRGRLTDLSGVVLASPFYRASDRLFDWATMSAYVDGFLTILDEGLRVHSGDQLADDVRRLMALRLREHLGPYSWMKFFDAYLRTPFLDVSAVRVPMLVVGGDRDVAARPADASALAAAVTGCRVELIADCGHFPMVERPETFNRIVNDFLARLSRRASGA
jgi:pimeloyl-ACP methyl ester carboxylesterase